MRETKTGCGGEGDCGSYLNGWVTQSNAGYIMTKRMKFSPTIIAPLVNIDKATVFSLFKILTIITKIFHIFASLNSQAMELLIIQKYDKNVTYCCSISRYY